MIHLLRVIHIVAGVIWVGGVFSLAVFLLPSARAAGPAAGPVVGQIMQVRQMPKWLIIAGFLTIAAGLWLYMLPAGTDSGWMASGPAKVYGVGAIFAITGWIVGMAVNAPLAKRISALGTSIAAAGVPPTNDQQAQMAAMQSRLGKLATFVATLLILATVTMAVARYVP
jgi:uncharacterized membrane protein